MDRIGSDQASQRSLLDSFWPCAAIAIGYLLLSIFLADRFPPVNSDEIVRANFGLERLHRRPARYTLFDDIFARPVYAMRDVLPESSIAMYHTWLGAWASLGSTRYRILRGSSIAAGLLALFMFYGLGTRVGGNAMGLSCMGVMAINPIFLSASCLARPETLLLFTSVGVLWLSCQWPETLGLKPFWVGSLASLQMSIHPNAFVFWLGLFIFYLWTVRPSDRRSSALLFAAGGLAGLLLALVWLDLPRVWLGFHTLHSYLLRPPILIWPWTPIDWLMQTVHVYGSGQTFYFDDRLVPGWTTCLHASWAGLSILVILAAAQARHPDSPFRFLRWGIAALIVLLAFAVFVKAKEFLYATTLFPFLIPVAASGLTSGRSLLCRVAKGASCVLLAGSFILFFVFSRSYAAKTKPYDQIVSDVRKVLPPGPLRIVGPNVLWLAFDKSNFRDVGALIFSRWYSGGRMDIKEWLSPWQPDILILDSGAHQVLWQVTKRDLPHNLQCRVDLLGVVETGSAYGPWEIYQIHWSEHAIQ